MYRILLFVVRCWARAYRCKLSDRFLKEEDILVQQRLNLEWSAFEVSWIADLLFICFFF